MELEKEHFENKEKLDKYLKHLDYRAIKANYLNDIPSIKKGGINAGFIGRLYNWYQGLLQCEYPDGIPRGNKLVKPDSIRIINTHLDENEVENW